MITEAQWEAITLERLAENDWQHVPGKDLPPSALTGRASWGDLVLTSRTLDAMRRLNPLVPTQYLEQALAEIVAPKSQDALAENYRLHEILVKGYRGITFTDASGVEHNPTIHLIGPRVDDNDRMAVSQLTIRSREVERRFDVVLYLNGLPVVFVELKRAAAQAAGLASAHASVSCG